MDEEAAAATAAYQLALAVHLFLDGLLGGRIETTVTSPVKGEAPPRLIAGDADYLRLAVLDTKDVLERAGHGSLIEQAQELTDDAGAGPVQGLVLLDALCAIAAITPETAFGPLPLPPGGTAHDSGEEG